MAVLTATREEEQLAELRRWQYTRFRELGFNRRQANLLVLARADWHRLEKLRERGWSHQQLMDVFL